jgi:MoaA/NifB/PqqE/SkfB family radical SAM enzyme
MPKLISPVDVNIKYLVSKFLHVLLKRRSKFPHHAHIEINNVCNYTCKMCPRDKFLKKEEIRNIDSETFKMIAERCTGIPLFTLAGFGEPLCDPHFFELVELLHRIHPNAWIRIITNGFFLSEENCQKFVSSAVNEIQISIDSLAHTDESLGHPINGIEEKLLNLSRTYLTRKKEPPLVITTVMTHDTYGSLENMFKLARTVKAHYINITRMDYVLGRGQVRPDITLEKKIYSRAQKLSRQYQLPVRLKNRFNIAMKIATVNSRHCPLLSDYIYITVDGKVAPCCVQRNFVIGDIIKESLETIWTPERFAHFDSERGKLCKDCDHIFEHQKGQ